MPTDIALLSEVKFFELLDDDERGLLASVVEIERIATGQTLFHAGEPGDCLYVVKNGAIEIFVKDTVGQKIVLTVCEAGDVFGELSLLDSGPRTGTAVALSDTDLIVLDRDDLRLLFQKKPDSALHMLSAMGRMTRKADELLRTRVSRNPNEEIQDKITLVESISDWIAWFSGSMYFLSLNLIWFTGWIVINTVNLGIHQFDQYPFGLLTMIVSLEAIFLSIFVLISQNRQAAKDRVRADIEYEVNIKAELEVAHLHEKTDRIREELLDRFARLEKAMLSTKAPASVSKS